MSNQPKVEDYYNQIAAEYHKIYEPEKMSYKTGIGDYFRLQILLRLLVAAEIRSVYEVGTGDGIPLALMYRMGLQVAGCDISPKMVEVACKRFKDIGLAEPNIILGDIENSITLAPQLAGGRYDAVVALGVMPHVKKDRLALDNMRMIVKTDGKLYIVFRNSLFSLFTFNRYTHEFVTQELLKGIAAPIVNRVSEELQKICYMDKPPIRHRAEEKNGLSYDMILGKFHNPLELPKLLSTSGFGNVKFHWYHFHAAQPWLADDLGDLYDEESIKLEHHTNDWRGMFLCSAVLVEADAK